jgi:hypothetical protein
VAICVPVVLPFRPVLPGPSVSSLRAPSIASTTAGVIYLEFPKVHLRIESGADAGLVANRAESVTSIWARPNGTLRLAAPSGYVTQCALASAWSTRSCAPLSVNCPFANPWLKVRSSGWHADVRWRRNWTVASGRSGDETAGAFAHTPS